MRFICCWQFKNEQNKLVKKVEILTSQADKVYLGRKELLNKISIEYNLGNNITAKEYNNDGDLINTGIFYIRPKRDNSFNNLSNIDIDFELEKYERNNAEEVPTHIHSTKNKVKPNKYWKINSQGIYNGQIQRFTRAIIVENMHKYILDEFSKHVLPQLLKPVQLQINIYIPINYANVSRRSGKTIWYPAIEGYEPSNDEDNISWLWIKCIKDCITKSKMWVDDTMLWCRGTNSMIYFIDELDDRKIEISFKEL